MKSLSDLFGNLADKLWDAATLQPRVIASAYHSRVQDEKWNPAVAAGYTAAEQTAFTIGAALVVSVFAVAAVLPAAGFISGDNVKPPVQPMDETAQKILLTSLALGFLQVSNWLGCTVHFRELQENGRPVMRWARPGKNVTPA